MAGFVSVCKLLKTGSFVGDQSHIGAPQILSCCKAVEVQLTINRVFIEIRLVVTLTTVFRAYSAEQNEIHTENLCRHDLSETIR
ncbi:hypothetical protein CA11_51620 [Gimesia maris]|nr:hypothetical protein CA11_51620 [Gimesia maris]